MDQALGLLTLLGRGPGIAVFPGAARRFSPSLVKLSDFCTQIGASLGFRDFYCCWNANKQRQDLDYFQKRAPVIPARDLHLFEPAPATVRYSQPVLKKLVSNKSTALIASLQWLIKVPIMPRASFNKSITSAIHDVAFRVFGSTLKKSNALL